MAAVIKTADRYNNLINYETPLETGPSPNGVCVKEENANSIIRTELIGRLQNPEK
jgi:hypothetical protein